MTALYESRYRSHSVLTCATSKSRLQKRYVFKMKDGLTDRVCSAYESAHRSRTPALNTALAAIEATVLSAGGRAQRTVKAIWRPSRKNQVVCCKINTSETDYHAQPHWQKRNTHHLEDQHPRIHHFAPFLPKLPYPKRHNQDDYGDGQDFQDSLFKQQRKVESSATQSHTSADCVIQITAHRPERARKCHDSYSLETIYA